MQFEAECGRCREPTGLRISTFSKRPQVVLMTFLEQAGETSQRDFGNSSFNDPTRLTSTLFSDDVRRVMGGQHA